MEILVCIKQVPDDSVEIHLNEAGNPDLEKVTPVVNAFDTYALEMATRLKEETEGEIIVLSIGDESVKNSLKNCLAVGADKAYYIEKEEYNKLDAVNIANLLKLGKEKIEEIEDTKFDMVFLGKESTDYATSQVGIILANAMDMPVAANIVEVKLEDNKAIMKQEEDASYNMIEAPLPTVLTVQKPDYEPRYPTIKTKMKARKKPIDKLEIEVTETPKIEVLKVYEPQKREAGVKIKTETVEEAVAKAMELINGAKVL